MYDEHLLEAQAILDRLHTSPAGLSPAEAAARLLQYGGNELQGKKQKSRLQIFLGQFKDLMIVLPLWSCLSWQKSYGIKDFFGKRLVISRREMGWVAFRKASRVITFRRNGWWVTRWPHHDYNHRQACPSSLLRPSGSRTFAFYKLKSIYNE